MITDFLIVIALGMGGGGVLALGLRRLFRRPAPGFEKVMVRQPGSVNFVIVERLVPR